MRVNVLNRMFVAAAVISAVSFVGTGVLTQAQQPPQQDPKQQQPPPPDPKKQDPKKKPPQRQAPPPDSQRQGPPPQKQKPPPDPPRQRPPQRQTPPQPPATSRPRLPEPQQQQRVGQQQQRLAQYGDHLDQQQRLGSQHAAQLQQQRRMAQFGFQQRYISRLHDQQFSLQNSRNYNYGGDPFFYTPSIYRYYRGGRYYETNEYGASVLRQAVNFGYEEGFEAGRADREDRWVFDYRNSYAYLDGNYGYTGFYVDRDDYNYYFREGFRRGYEDGYYSRYQYGSYSGGTYSISRPVLSVILTFQSIR